MICSSYNDIIVLALGSNCGDMLLNIKSAINMLPLYNRTYSHIYKSMALLPENASSD